MCHMIHVVYRIKLRDSCNSVKQIQWRWKSVKHSGGQTTKRHTICGTFLFLPVEVSLPHSRLTFSKKKPKANKRWLPAFPAGGKRRFCLWRMFAFLFVSPRWPHLSSLSLHNPRPQRAHLHFPVVTTGGTVRRSEVNVHALLLEC